jgi:hypothetical protein
MNNQNESAGEKIPVTRLIPGWLISETTMLMGALTTCWGNMLGAGVFDSTRAAEIAEQIHMMFGINAEEILLYQQSFHEGVKLGKAMQGDQLPFFEKDIHKLLPEHVFNKLIDFATAFGSSLPTSAVANHTRELCKYVGNIAKEVAAYQHTRETIKESENEQHKRQYAHNVSAFTKVDEESAPGKTVYERRPALDSKPFHEDLRRVLNIHCIDSITHMPDVVLADYLQKQIINLNSANAEAELLTRKPKQTNY